MEWSKDSYEWRSETHKKDFIEEIKRIFYGDNAHIGTKALNAVNSISPPFRVTQLSGRSGSIGPSVVEIIDSKGTVYTNQNIEQSSLFPAMYRSMFKKVPHVRTPLEKRNDEIELLTLLDMLPDLATVRVGSAPVSTKQDLLKLLRASRDDRVAYTKRMLKDHQKRLAAEKEQCSEHYDTLKRLGVEDPNE